MFSRARLFGFILGLSITIVCSSLSAGEAPLAQDQTLGNFLLGKERLSSIETRRVSMSSPQRHERWTIIPGEIGSWNLRHLLTHAMAYNDISQGDTIFDIPAGTIILTQDDDDDDSSSDHDDDDDTELALLGLGALGIGAGAYLLLGGDFGNMEPYHVHVDFPTSADGQ